MGHNRPEAGVFGWQFSVFSQRVVWSPRRPIYAVLRYQLIARATYLPKGYLTKPRLRLRCDSQTRFGNKAQIYRGLQSLQNLFINRIADGHAVAVSQAGLWP